MVGVLLVSLVYWLGQRDRIPQKIRIATGRENGQYHSFGSRLAEILRDRNPNLLVEIELTEGTGDNVDRLMNPEDPVDFAIVQGGAAELAGVGNFIRPVILAPLYPEVMHVVVREDINVTNIAGLAGRRIIIGGHKSGMRVSANTLLRQYNLLGSFDEAETNYFDALPNDNSIDAAIVTSGVQNSVLKTILESGDFEVLEITDARAMEISDPYFRTYEIPKGLFREQPPVPPAPVPTITTTAFLVARPELSPSLAQEILETIYEEGMRLRFPTLQSKENAKQWLDLPMHPVARRYFDPQDEIGHMAAVMESLAATKELLFALAAGIYLLWERWRRLKEKEKQAELTIQKKHLGQLLTRTVEIEAQQIGETDETPLRGMLDDVTRIKLQALEELTHEGLRDDRSFLIFLTQCSSLISKIQAKIANSQAGKSRQTILTAVGIAAGAMVFLLGGRQMPREESDD